MITEHERTYLQAALECDSITSENLRLQTLKRLEAKGLLVAWDSEWVFNPRPRCIVRYFISDAGRELLAAQP